VRAYTVAGLTLVTEREIPELSETEGTDGAWTVEYTPGPVPGDLGPARESLTWDGRVWLSISGDGARYAIRFPELAEFLVEMPPRRISCHPAPGTEGYTIRHLLIDQVVPRVLALDGSLVLHASAVATDEGALAFVGPSGYGKSSLAAGFVTGGARPLADDFLVLSEGDDRFAVLPAYPGLRLWPDSAAFFGGAVEGPVSENNDKVRVDLGRRLDRTAAVPLRALVVLSETWLEYGTECVVVRMTPREAYMAVYPQAFRMERSGRDRQVAELDRFSRLVSSTTVLRLDYHRAYDQIPAVRAALLAALDALGTPPA
jgi:hypothetical protein